MVHPTAWGRHRCGGLEEGWTAADYLEGKDVAAWLLFFIKVLPFLRQTSLIIPAFLVFWFHQLLSLLSPVTAAMMCGPCEEGTLTPPSGLITAVSAPPSLSELVVRCEVEVVPTSSPSTAPSTPTSPQTEEVEKDMEPSVEEKDWRGETEQCAQEDPMNEGVVDRVDGANYKAQTRCSLSSFVKLLEPISGSPVEASVVDASGIGEVAETEGPHQAHVVAEEDDGLMVLTESVVECTCQHRDGCKQCVMVECVERQYNIEGIEIKETDEIEVLNTKLVEKDDVSDFEDLSALIYRNTNLLKLHPDCEDTKTLAGDDLDEGVMMESTEQSRQLWTRTETAYADEKENTEAGRAVDYSLIYPPLPSIIPVTPCMPAYAMPAYTTNQRVSRLLEASEPLLQPSFSYAQTVLIFDWDDTLMPSTWISRNRLTLDEECKVPQEVMDSLSVVAACSKRTLEVAEKFGRVVIVTNAEEGWVELSCNKFMPSLRNHINRYKILSARTSYESEECPNPFMWKRRAFRDEIERHFILHYPNASRNIVSIGDSTHERLALLEVCKRLQDNAMYEVFPKSIKFLERPNVDDLQKEHEIIVGMFHSLIHHIGDLDLCILANSEREPELVLHEQSQMTIAVASPDGIIRETQERRLETQRGGVILSAKVVTTVESNKPSKHSKERSSKREARKTTAAVAARAAAQDINLSRGKRWPTGVGGSKPTVEVLPKQSHIEVERSCVFNKGCKEDRGI